jgi:outer membrane biosynthesis protein TonB
MHEADTVNTGPGQEEQILRDQVERSEKILDGLGRDLHAIDAELSDFAQKHHHYDLLSQACRSLEELENLGAADLFWGGPADSDARKDQLRHARQKVDQYEAEKANIEARRQSIVDEIGARNEELDALHYELIDAIEQEERRKDEWIVEREIGELPSRALVMPWTRGCDEDRRFRQSLAASILTGLAVGWLVSVVDLPIPERADLIEVPERVAKLVREELPPPPPKTVEEPLVAEEEPPEPQPVEETPPEEITEPVEKPLVAETPQPQPKKPASKEQVKSKGILAFRDSFAARAQNKMTARLGSQAKLGNAGDKAVGRPERSMVTTTAPGSSGGINLASISRDVGGGGQGIGEVQLSRVASSIGGGGDGPDRPVSGGAFAGRTDEEIQIVFDRYKAALYRLYNRELRKDPTLRGQLVLRLTIEPDGSVSLCQLQSSDMGAPMLAEQIVDRVRTFDFGAKDGIVAMTIIYPIDFLPAA